MSQTRRERPILVEYFQQQDEYSYISDNTPIERRPIRLFEVWIDYDAIPATPPTQTPFPGTPDGAMIVSGISGVALTQVPGNPYLYESTLGHFLNMVPAPFQENAYKPTLRDANGAEVPFDPSVWVADGSLRLVAFKYLTPQKLGYTPPFTFAYWRYIGAFISPGPVVGGTNVGGGPGLVFQQVVAGIIQFRSIRADPTLGSEGLAISTPIVPNTEVRVGNTLTGTNLGAGAQLFAAKTPGALLQFRSLLAAPGSGIALTQNANDITLDATPGSVVSLANEGVGTGHVFDSVVGTTANLRTFQADPLAANSGIAVADSGTEINVGNTLTGANLGAGAQLFAAKTPGALLQFRSLLAAPGSGIALTQNANDITLDAAPGSVVSLANEGVGTGHVFDSVVGTTANLRTFQADPLAANSGIAVADSGTEINVGNTLTGANLGAGAQLFAAKTPGALLQFRSLLAVPGSGIALTQNANDIQIAGTGAAYSRTVVNVPVYAVLPADDIVAVVHSATGNTTINLPAIGTLGGPKRYTIVDEGGGAFVHPITVAAAGGDTIIGAASVALENNYNSINIYHNGATGWFIA